jgi:hypothetical protein
VIGWRVSLKQNTLYISQAGMGFALGQANRNKMLVYLIQSALSDAITT